MLHVQFFLRNALKTDPLKLATIYCQLAIEGEKRDTPFSTQVKVPPVYWNGERATPDYALADNVNRQLLNIRKAIMDIFDMHAIMHAGTDITYAFIRDHYLGDGQIKQTKETPKFTEALARLMEYKENVQKVEKGTLKRYRTRYQAVMAYLKDSKQQDIRISEIRHAFIENFKSYLATQQKPDGTQAFCKNSINKYLSLVSSVIDFAIKKEWIQFRPLGKMNLAYEKPKPPKYLTPDLRQLILSSDFPSAEKTKDIAIFLMHTGFSYTDYLSLKNEHLLGNCFRKARNKTGIFSMPILLPETKKIIEKYGCIDNLPRPDMSDLNKELKYLGDLVGINEKTVGFNLSTSVFRDTFISMMENEYMIDERTLMRMSGHTNRRQLDTYSNISPDRMIYELKERNKNFKLEI